MQALNAQPRVLQVWEEVIGVLLQVYAQDEGEVIVNISGRIYVLKNFPEKLLENLKAHVQNLVGILRTEDGYAMRVISRTKYWG